MLTVELFGLWDINDGLSTKFIYLDRESAEIGLMEHFTTYWIESGQAKIIEIPGISYVKKAIKP